MSRQDDSALRQQLIELAHEKPRFGYRRLHVLLRRTGQRINHKRVQRVYRAAGLCVRRLRSCITAVAVKGLLSDAMRNSVSGLIGRRESRSEYPKPFDMC